MDSEDAVNCLYSIIKDGDVHRLKFVLREIENDYENPCDYLLRQCRNIAELESYLKDHSYLFIVENGRVARSTDELESGRGNADKYFEEELKKCADSVEVEELRKHVDDAPRDVKTFIESFYPQTEFKRFLQLRPNVFATSKENKRVCLVQRESVKYFQQAVKIGGEGLRFTSLRGHVGQAPDHVRAYINAQYPGTEFRYFLEDNGHAFVLNGHGGVYLAR